ncbi:MAG: YraN family protein [Ruminococcaceae bacterium]|nr:YraN family protein [Oscillospiraceae bacterium]
MLGIFRYSKKIKKYDGIPFHLAVGKFGEEAAQKLLRKKGYRIVDTDVHVGRSELDIVATKDDTLVFFEVKTRTAEEGEIPLTRPADAVNKEKATYLIRGANKYIKETFVFFGSYFKRFDLIEVYAEKKGEKLVCKEIKHFENAIRKR